MTLRSRSPGSGGRRGKGVPSSGLKSGSDAAGESEPAEKRKQAARSEARGEAIKAFKRQLILDAARRVFAEHGLEGASVRTIASVAGCTTGAIYPYFKGKEDIYGALLSESLESLFEAVSAAAAKGKTPEERLRLAFRGFFVYYRDRPSEVALGLYLFGGVKAAGLTPELDRLLNRQLLNVLGIMGEHIGGFSQIDPQAIQVEVTAAFTYLIGLLILYHTSRLKILVPNADGLIEHYVAHTLTRLKKAK